MATVRLVPPTLKYSGGRSEKHTISARDILSYSRVQNHVAKMAVYAYDPSQAATSQAATSQAVTGRNVQRIPSESESSSVVDTGLKYISINFHRVSVRV